MQNNRRRNPSKSHIYNNNRSTYQSNNYGRRETPEPESQSSSPVRGVYGDAQTAIVMCSILGTQTTVKTRNNNVYKGHTTGFSEKGDIAMRDVKLESGQDEHGPEDPNLPGIIIPKDGFVVCATYGVDMKGLCSGQDFTDSSIASKLNGSTDSPLRELQPWQDDDAPEMSIELDGKSSGWEPAEMFQVNSEKFHVKSSYSEDLLEYTTKLPAPGSDSYEEKLRFAEKHAAEIERSEAYQNRISKELSDGDEESKFSSVHRGGDNSHRSQESGGSGKNVYTIPALRGESDTGLRNGNHSRNQSRGNMQRQNSPYSSSSHGQHHVHRQDSRQDSRPDSRQDTRQLNNHYHQGPAVSASGPLHRNQSSATHQRQPLSTQNNHTSTNSHQYHQQPSQVVQSNHSSPQNQQLRSPHQQTIPPQGHQNKQHQPQQTVPPSMPNAVSAAKMVPSQQNNKPIAGSPRQHIQQPVNSEPINSDSTHKHADPTPSQAYSKQDQGDGPSASVQQKPCEITSPGPAESDSQAVVALDNSATSVTGSDRRLRSGVESSPEESRNKVKQLQEFHQNFNLDSQSTSSAPDEISADTPTSTSVPSVSSSAVSSASVSQISEPPQKLKEDEEVQKSKLNPMAKEFKPSAGKPFVAPPMEAQSPSPQSRSPHYIQPIAAAHYPYAHPQSFLPVGIPTPVHTAALLAQPMSRKKATVSVGPVNDHLTAHQVTGQPLMATQSVIHFQPLQGMPQAGYQVINMANPPARMMNPIGQGGQHQSLEQAGSQNQPQPVFMTAQQLGAIPAHLPPHPQPAHAHQHTASSQPQTVHAPNPAPSPVQHPPQPHSGQPVPHHMPQGPPQSVTPQPQHYQQMNAMHGNMQPMPRTSMAGQQHQVSQSHQVSYPMSMSTPQYSYPTASAAQYTYAPAPQPQTSQNSSHGPGPQPQYVVMPQPGHQGHPPMQQHAGQPYPGAVQFQTQHNIMQGPPQMPPNHGHNPAQGAPHLIHSGMQGMPASLHHPQVPGTPPGMFMPVTQQFQHQQQ